MDPSETIGAEAGDRLRFAAYALHFYYTNPFLLPETFGFQSYENLRFPHGRSDVYNEQRNCIYSHIPGIFTILLQSGKGRGNAD